MSKRLTITPEIRAQLNRAFGGPVQAEDYALYEAASLNTLPIQQMGSLFNGGLVSEALLAQFPSFLEKQGSVQLISMHAKGSLPSGKVFAAFTRRTPRGKLELVTRFAVTLAKGELVHQLDDGTIDGVSMSFSTEHMYCSACGWDYRSDEGSLIHYLSQTCENGHTLGEDGTHLKLDGLAHWSELSLVGQGASPGAKILWQNPQGVIDQLAASGLPKDTLTIQLTAEKEPPMPENLATVNLAELTGMTTKLVTAETAVATLTAELATVKATVAELTPQVAELAAAKAELATAKALAAEATTLKAAFEAQAKKFQVALKDTSELPTDVAGLVKYIDDAQVKLASILPVGGKGEPADKDKNPSLAYDNAAFTLRATR